MDGNLFKIESVQYNVIRFWLVRKLPFDLQYQFIYVNISSILYFLKPGSDRRVKEGAPFKEQPPDDAGVEPGSVRHRRFLETHKIVYNLRYGDPMVASKIKK